MKSLVVEGALPYLPTYQAVWAGEQRDAPLIAATCRLVEQLVCQVRTCVVNWPWRDTWAEAGP